MKFRTAYGKSEGVAFDTDPVSLTHQSEAPQCDINTIMLKYEKTGVLAHTNRFQGQYGDFSDAPQDYHESMNSVLAAQEMFETLPAKIRRRFHNDPGAFIEFATNSQNADELIALGLAKKPGDGDVIENDPTPSKKAKEPPAAKSEPPEDGQTSE